MGIPKAKLTFFALAMMNVAAVFSLRGLPLLADQGYTMIFYIAFAAILFLLPVSMVSAELATGWPRGGGVFVWVKEAFGERWGFFAIWLQWIQNVIWYPTQLAFVAGSLAYLCFSPTLAENKGFMLGVIVLVYWASTLLNFFGVSWAAKIASLGVILGTVVPAVGLVALAIYWASTGHSVAIAQSGTAAMPDLSNFSSLAFLGGIVLLFAGMEVGAVHVQELKNPRKDYLKSLLLSVILIITVALLGAIAVSIVVPRKGMNLTAGVMQCFNDLFTNCAYFHDFLGIVGLNILLSLLGGMIAFSATASVIAWLAGPSKGLLATREFGCLPPIMQKTNSRGVQKNILLIQGGIVSLLALAFVVMPNVSSAFFLLTTLAAMLYLIMYLFLYAAAIKLRISQPDVPRTFKVPGGLPGLCFFAGIGIAAVLFAMTVSWVPPTSLSVASPMTYVLFLAGGVALLGGAPLLIYARRKPHWQYKPTEENDGP